MQPSHRVCKPAYLVPVQARINWEGCVRKGILRKMVGMAELGASISLDGVAVHPDCWCICYCLCYLHFAPENPEDGEMYLLVAAHLGGPGQSPESHKMVVCECTSTGREGKWEEGRGEGEESGTSGCPFFLYFFEYFGRHHIHW